MTAVNNKENNKECQPPQTQTKIYINIKYKERKRVMKEFF